MSPDIDKGPLDVITSSWELLAYTIITCNYLLQPGVPEGRCNSRFGAAARGSQQGPALCWCSSPHDHKVAATEPTVPSSQFYSKAGKRGKVVVSFVASPLIWRVFPDTSQQISLTFYWPKPVICPPLAKQEAGKSTRWPERRGLEMRWALHDTAVWAVLAPAEIIFLSAVLNKLWAPLGRSPPQVFLCILRT